MPYTMVVRVGRTKKFRRHRWTYTPEEADAAIAQNRVTCHYVGKPTQPSCSHCPKGGILQRTFVLQTFHSRIIDTTPRGLHDPLDILGQTAFAIFTVAKVVKETHEQAAGLAEN